MKDIDNIYFKLSFDSVFLSKRYVASCRNGVFKEGCFGPRTLSWDLKSSAVALVHENSPFPQVPQANHSMPYARASPTTAAVFSRLVASVPWVCTTCSYFIAISLALPSLIPPPSIHLPLFLTGSSPVTPDTEGIICLSTFFNELAWLWCGGLLSHFSILLVKSVRGDLTFLSSGTMVIHFWIFWCILPYRLAVNSCRTE